MFSLLFQVLMQAQAQTYPQAMPVSYSLKNDDPYFKIDPVSGVITLYNTLDQVTLLGFLHQSWLLPLLTPTLPVVKSKKNYSFVIVAKDSAPFPDQQSVKLTKTFKMFAIKQQV